MEDWIDSQIDGRVAAGFDARIARADARSSPPVNAAGEVASELGIAANWRMNAALTTKPEWAAEYAALARDHISNARAIRAASTGA